MNKRTPLAENKKYLSIFLANYFPYYNCFFLFTIRKVNLCCHHVLKGHNRKACGA